MAFVLVFCTILLFHFVQQSRFTTATQLESIARSVREPLSAAILKADIPEAEAILSRIQPAGIVSRADVVAVLISTVENLLDALQEGKQVDFGELGKFRLQILNEGAESLEKFTSTNITGVNIQYIPGEDLKNIFAGLEFQPVASRKAQQAVLRAEKAGETSVDISKKPASGGDDSESPDEI